MVTTLKHRQISFLDRLEEKQTKENCINLTQKHPLIPLEKFQDDNEAN